MTWNYEVTHNEDGTFSIALPDGEELRIVPPKREWVGLTDEEIKQIELSLRQYNSRDTYDLSLKDFAKAIEAKLKEKNNG